MTATSNILVPLDGSELAEEALGVAVDIAKPSNGTITLFIAVEPEAAEALLAYADSEEIATAKAVDA
jgi:nucleotide-binding universal stress UspA family protein